MSRVPTFHRCAPEATPAAAIEEEGEEEEEEEEGEFEDEEFEELPEEFEEVRGAFLDRPGQMLDVEKILRETDHIEHGDVPEGFRTGYVTIVGSPNVGKSTLMNNMIGDRLSIVTPKVGVYLSDRSIIFLLFAGILARLADPFCVENGGGGI